MKCSHFFIALGLFLTATCSWSNNQDTTYVWNDDLKQQDFAEFAAGNYTQVNGDVFIVKTKLTSLSQLKKLTHVKGKLSIKENIQLVSLNGLSGIERVGELVVSNNSALTDMSGFSKIAKLNALSIMNNASLESLNGLDGLVSVSSSLTIENNLSLTTLKGLGGLKQVGTLKVYKNPWLESFEGLKNLQSVDTFIIDENKILKTTKGTKRLQAINKKLHIEDNILLHSLEGFDALKTLGELEINYGNKRLSELSGFKRLETLGKFRMRHHFPNSTFPALTYIDELWVDIEGSSGQSLTKLFPKVIKIKELSIGDTKQLSAKGFLPKLTELETLNIYGVHGFSDLDGFNALKTAKDVHINSPSIKTISGLKSLERVTGELKVHQTGIEHIKGFNALSGALAVRIYNNKALKSIEGFNKLDDLLAVVDIKDNEQLQTVDAFNKVELVNKLNVIRNGPLTSVKGFANLKQVSKNLNIFDNYHLTTLNFPSLEGIGELDINNNHRLTSLNGFKHLQGAERIDIRKNGDLKDLTGLGQLKVAGVLSVGKNSGLKNFNGLTSLKELAYLFVYENNALTSLDGLDALQTIHNGKLVVKENKQLKNLNGLQNVSSFKEKGVLEIKNNKQLADYDALSMVVLKNMPAQRITLYGNADNPSWDYLKLSAMLTKEPITPELLASKTFKELSLLRNEVFARQGYEFSEELQPYFEKKGWYKKSEDQKITLTDIEEQNVKTIKAEEQSRKDRIKTAVLNLRKDYKKGIKQLGDFRYLEKTLQSFVKHIDIKALLASETLSYSELYFVKNDGCEDKVAIRFDDGSNAGNFSIQVHYCDNKYDDLSDCALRIKTAKKSASRTDYMGNGCSVNIEGEYEFGNSFVNSSVPTLEYKTLETGKVKLISSYDAYDEEGDCCYDEEGY